MNRLVPYLDLFMRLDDAEMSRLAGVESELVATLRRQVVEISEGLAEYLDLLPRLTDDELVRLTGASAKTVRFWRLCQPRGSAARSSEARAEISSITPMPRPAPTPPQQPAPPRDEQPTELRRRTTGMSLQATMVQGGASASQSQPVANWSHESSLDNAATTITPPPHQLPTAAWDTTSPTSGTETMVTPITQVPAAWDASAVPSETTTLPAAASSRAPRPAAAAAVVDPSERQVAAARTLDINGEPFPGFEWPSTPEDDGFSLSELDS